MLPIAQEPDLGRRQRIGESALTPSEHMAWRVSGHVGDRQDRSSRRVRFLARGKPHRRGERVEEDEAKVLRGRRYPGLHRRRIECHRQVASRRRHGGADRCARGKWRACPDGVPEDPGRTLREVGDSSSAVCIAFGLRLQQRTRGEGSVRIELHEVERHACREHLCGHRDDAQVEAHQDALADIALCAKQIGSAVV